MTASGATQSIVIHGHFYQPPRDDPWFEEIEAEASAAPYHDWNERIERECYRTVVAAHLTGGGADNRIVGVVNTLEWISFNFGATLLEWLARHAPSTYASILAADRASVQRLGYGNAMAQPYHHVILPLASRRDKLTEVRWGIADFRRRFGREPQGMWLPETAVDNETLEVLAECGIRFTVLAPHQVALRPPNGLPAVYRAAAGRTIALFTYDGDLSHGVAFGGLLNNAGTWAARLLRSPARLTSIATDGETYGHHHKFGEMALARVISVMRGQRHATLENFASFLAHTSPAQEARLVENTSWSCAHGIERWRSNCGCRAQGDRYPSQAWRTPLRAGLDALAAQLHARYEREAATVVADPWQLRDDYGAVLHAPLRVRQEFVRSRAANAPLPETLELLEMQRDALRMYSSCAWFFDDIGGLEPRQVLRYAAHACDLAARGDAAVRDQLERELTAHLAHAESNETALGTGRTIYEQHVRPRIHADVRTAAALAAATALGISTTSAAPRAYRPEVTSETVALTNVRTGREARLRADTGGVQSAAMELTVRVQRDGAAASELVHLNDFPERARRLIRTHVRHALLAKSLSDEELTALAQGDATLRDLAGKALVRALHAIPNDDSGATLRHATLVLDLLAQLETPIPFDAQAAWWQVRDLQPVRDAQFLQLGHRLGFDTSVTQ